MSAFTNYCIINRYNKIEMLFIKEREINIRDIYHVGGLIFYTEEDYLIFKNIDRNISQTVKLVKNGSIDLEKVFNDIEKIRVIEFNYNARKELFGFFKNATDLLSYKGTHFVTEYKVGCCFYDKFIIVEYFKRSNNNNDDNDNDNDDN